MSQRGATGENNAEADGHHAQNAQPEALDLSAAPRAGDAPGALDALQPFGPARGPIGDAPETPLAELLERYFLDLPAPEERLESGRVDHAAVARVDAVMHVAEAGVVRWAPM